MKPKKDSGKKNVWLRMEPKRVEVDDEVGVSVDANKQSKTQQCLSSRECEIKPSCQHQILPQYA